MITRWLIFGLLFCSSALTAMPLHAIHISFAKLEWSANTLTGKISLYKDDYTKALNDWSHCDALSLSPSDQNALRLRYLRNFFRVWSNGTERQLQLEVTRQTEDESSYIYEFTFALPAGTRLLTLDNQILFRQFSDETNLIVLKHGEKEYNYSFTPSSATFVVE